MKNEHTHTHPVELLAPAGNADSAFAAFDSGADAIYAGLKKFNARERSDNFSFDEMGRVIAYASKIGRKVYITFNTLVKECELKEAARFLMELEQLGPSAVIVQDIGIVRMIREYFPRLKIHASTQMGLHNSLGLSFAEKLGVERVILERQTSLDELAAMMKTKPASIELEMFVHGALCCCVSGTCLLSSWLGGWSGNRGKCKQPCRRRHHSAEGNGFFLSTQDLCMIDMIPEIVKTGVASLKIEGRLRPSDYVSNVVSAYSLALDNASDPEAFAEILPKCREMLSRTGGRRWSHGFYTSESAENLIKYDSLGASGQLCGKVISASGKGFTVSVSRRLHIGDTIRVQPPSGDEGPALRITKMSVDGENASRALKGENCFINSDKPVVNGSFVYRTSGGTQDYSSRLDSLPERRSLCDITVEISRSLVSISTPFGKWEKACEFSEASNRPADPASLEREFTSLGCERLSIVSAPVTLNGNPFIPSSVLKGIRRDFREWMDATASFAPRAVEAMTGFERFEHDLNELRAPEKIPVLPDAFILPKNTRVAVKQGAATVRCVGDTLLSQTDELLLPFFVPEFQLSGVLAAIDAFVKAGGTVIRASSLQYFGLHKKYPALKIRTNAPLPVCNSMATLELSALGAVTAQAHIELEKASLEDLASKSILPLELYRYGRPVLLTTRAHIPAEGELTDSRGNAFRIIHDGVFTELTPGRVMSLPPVAGFASELYDLRDTPSGAKDTVLFNFDYTLS